MKFISIQNIFFSYMSEDEGQPIVNSVDGVSLEIEKGLVITDAENQLSPNI